MAVRPQPAPRLSITSSRSPSNQSLVQSKVNELENIYGRCMTPSDNLNLSTKCLRSPNKEFSPGKFFFLLLDFSFFILLIEGVDRFMTPTTKLKIGPKQN